MSQYMTFFMKSTLYSGYFLHTKYYGGEINININKMCSNTTTLRQLSVTRPICKKDIDTPV